MPAHVDLTQPIEDGMQTYPGDPAVSVTDHATHAADGYHVESLSCGSHTGTHIDAPRHTEPDGDPLSAFSLDRFVFDAVRVDCRDCDAREAITSDRLPTDDALADADMVVCWTGWDDHWNTDRYLDHPYVGPETAARCADHGLAVGIDARDGRVATKGWAEATDVIATDLARSYQDAGVAAIIYTDINRDGAMQGPNVDATAALANAVSIPVIASGGVSSLEDLIALRDCGAPLNGAISGRALYDGALDLEQALGALRG